MLVSVCDLHECFYVDICTNALMWICACGGYVGQRLPLGIFLQVPSNFILKHDHLPVWNSTNRLDRTANEYRELD